MPCDIADWSFGCGMSDKAGEYHGGAELKGYIAGRAG